MQKYGRHLLVIPEDDANRQIANGFRLSPRIKSNFIRVLPPAGGWVHVVESFRRDHATDMYQYRERIIVLLIDFDGDANRLKDVQSKLPPNLTDRVFVLGTYTEPERLKPTFGSYEKLGLALAADCNEELAGSWNHPLLIHNAVELERLCSCLGDLVSERR